MIDSLATLYNIQCFLVLLIFCRLYGDCYCVIERLFEGVAALCIERSIYYLYDIHTYLLLKILHKKKFFFHVYTKQKKIHHHFELNDMILNIIGLNGCYKKKLRVKQWVSVVIIQEIECCFLVSQTCLNDHLELMITCCKRPV